MASVNPSPISEQDPSVIVSGPDGYSERPISDAARALCDAIAALSKSTAELAAFVNRIAGLDESLLANSAEHWHVCGVHGCGNRYRCGGTCSPISVWLCPACDLTDTDRRLSTAEGTF